jgi:uncharacterized protein
MSRFIRHPLRLALMLLAFCTTSVTAGTPQKFPVTELAAGIYLIKAEVASKENQRQQGLMFREKMGLNEGMVFVFERPAMVCMWMKDTPLPLSVAVIGEDGKIVSIADMTPFDETSHCAGKMVLYALEMNQGWFKKKNIKPGTEIKGLPITK